MTCFQPVLVTYRNDDGKESYFGKGSMKNDSQDYGVFINLGSTTKEGLEGSGERVPGCSCPFREGKGSAWQLGFRARGWLDL